MRNPLPTLFLQYACVYVYVYMRISEYLCVCIVRICMYCMYDVNVIHIQTFCYIMYSHFGNVVDMAALEHADTCFSRTSEAFCCRFEYILLSAISARREAHQFLFAFSGQAKCKYAYINIHTHTCMYQHTFMICIPAYTYRYNEV
jgi:hypothetical protein